MQTALWHSNGHMDQNLEEGIYSLKFEAGHRTFVKQWEVADGASTATVRALHGYRTEPPGLPVRGYKGLTFGEEK